MRNRSWLWGAFFLLSAVFVIGSQTGAFGQIGILSIVATVLLCAIFINSLIDIEFFGMFMSIALLYLIYTEPLNLIPISPWVLIFAGILTSIGFSIIFKGRTFKYRHKKCYSHGEYKCENFSQTTENVDGDNPFLRVSFGSASKYLHADSLKSGNFSASFGTLEVFFDQVQLSPEGAEIFVDCSFGEIKLFIPKAWDVTESVHVGLGSVKNKNRMSRPEENSPKLNIVGNVQFGDVEINYI